MKTVSVIERNGNMIPAHPLSEWQALFVGREWETPFQRPEWVLTLLHHESKAQSLSPLFFARRDGEMWAVLALQFERTPLGLGAAFSFPGGWMADCNDVLCLNGTSHTELASFLWECLERLDKWDALLLRELRSPSPTVDALLELVTLRRLRFDIRASAEVPVVDTSCEWESYLKQRSRRFRRSLAGSQNRWKRAGYKVIEVSNQTAGSGGDLDEAMRICSEIERDSLKPRGAKMFSPDSPTGSLLSEFCRAFDQRLALKVNILYAQDKPVAYIISLLERRVLHTYNMAFRADEAANSPGSFLFFHLIRNGFSDPNLDRISLGRGSFPHKTRWATDIERRVNLRVYAPTAIGRALFFLACCQSKMKASLRSGGEDG